MLHPVTIIVCSVYFHPLFDVPLNFTLTNIASTDHMCSLLQSNLVLENIPTQMQEKVKGIQANYAERVDWKK